MEFHFDNLTLRSLTTEDSRQFFDVIDRNRVRLTDYFPVTISEITSLATCTKYVDEKIEQALEKEHYTFVIEDASENLQGLFFLKNIDWRIPKGELAYFIDHSLERKGIMTKALSRIISYCFQTFEMNKLFILTATDNLSSRKIAEKTGFEIEGILRKNFKLASGELMDMVYYGILKPPPTHSPEKPL